MSQQINFMEIKIRVEQRIKGLANKIGTEAVSFTKDNFRSQGFRDTTLNPWQNRKSGAKRNNGRALLVQSGRLKRSIRKLRISSHSVTIGSDVPYASAHNDGFKGVVQIPQHTRVISEKQQVGTGVWSIKSQKERKKGVKVAVGEVNVKAHQRRMNLPQRKYLGPSQTLSNRIRRLINREIKEAFQ